MRMERVQSSDAGSYSCHVNNGIGDELIAHFALVVKGIFFFSTFGLSRTRHLFCPPLDPLCTKRNEALFGPVVSS